MVATALDVQTISSRYPDPFDTVVWTAADVSNHNTYASTGREIVLVRNPDSGAHTYGVTSKPDYLGRTLDISGLLPAGDVAIAYLGIDGYRDPATLLVTLTANNAALEWAVVRLTN